VALHASGGERDKERSTSMDEDARSVRGSRWQFGSVKVHSTWVVARLGAAMHYAVPSILHRAGSLERFYTDFYAGAGATRLLSFMPRRWRGAAINRALGRVARGLPENRIRSYPILGLEYYVRQAFAENPRARDEVFLWVGEKFGRLVTRDGFGKARGVYTFTTAALEILRAARHKGLATVLEQTIAPRAVEEDLLATERGSFPGWEPVRDQDISITRTTERERAEWQLADVIICGSEFVRQGVAQCGGPAERCLVIPYGVDATFSRAARPPHDGPLRVLSVGKASLRKGIGYAAETARLLDGAATFRWVGSADLLPSARKNVERYVTLVGAVPRNQIISHFEWADVFFLPSVCEGSATVTYEALISGLPVIATPNTGSVVTDGVNGFIVPPRDIQTMVDRLQRLNLDRGILLKMQEAARRSCEVASLEAYEGRLLRALCGVIDGNRRG
jgi:glycosyltransferase involved in cell wall biosynthesis